MKYVALYVLGIVLCNLAFYVLPLVPLGQFGAWPPASLLVGLLFVVRDFAQREVGHKVVLAMLVGAALSYWMASPFIALASLAAFLVSETVDWVVYSWSPGPFARRILLSSAISTPIDSAVFLWMIGHFSWLAVLLMTLSKMAGALLIWKMSQSRATVPATSIN